MTGREDAPISGVNAEHAYKQENFHNRQSQGEMHGRQEMNKSIIRSGQSLKSSKPTQPIYRPPKIISKNGPKVHFQTAGSPTKSSSPPTGSTNIELKSALKRSKSFTSNETTEFSNFGFERDSFPLEYQGLIKRAMLDPNILSCQKLMELVRLICSKAIENVQFSVSAAKLCFCIIEKEHNHTFLESLLNCCREWYNERDKLLRTSFLPSSGSISSSSSRWVAYISFLSELYSRVKSQHSQIIPTSVSLDLLVPHPNSPMAHLATTLQTLLYECSHIILRPPSLNNIGEVDCLRKMLSSIGKQLESDSPHRMQQVMAHLRDAFANPSINAQIRKSILELVELHASNWQLDLSQMMYYFPYTNLDRK